MKTCDCGRQTNSPSGRCAICQLLGRDTEPSEVLESIDIKEEKKDMGVAKLAPSKVCQECGQEFKPTSNVQKYCPECKVKRKNEKDRQYRAKKETSIKKKGNTSKPTPQNGDVISALEARKAELTQKVEAIDYAISVIQEIKQ